jgi:hypothetical protein
LAVTLGLPFNRHHPRMRMIQYSETLVINRGGAAYWMPAFAGLTAVLCLHANALSYTEQSLAPQVRKQWQQRQTEDGEMIALNPLEQVNPQTFKLVGADT